MSTTAYADQLRSGLMQVREKLIAAMDTAAGGLNAAQAKLAQQTTDASKRAEAHERAALLQRVITATESTSLFVANLTSAIVASAATANEAATGLISALEDSGRAVRGCVEAKDSLLGEVERVAGIARNHLRMRSPAGSTTDPLCRLAERVASLAESAGAKIEMAQQQSVQASILAARSLAGAVHDQWREASMAVTTVQKEASSAREDAAAILAATFGSNQEVRTARFASWERRGAADQAMLAFREGLKDVDGIVNGNLQVRRRNTIKEGKAMAGFSAAFRIDKPEVAPCALGARGAHDRGQEAAATPAQGAPRVVFFVVPSQAASGFTRSAAAAALCPLPDPTVQPPRSRAVEGELINSGGGQNYWSYRSREALCREVGGGELAFGHTYCVFAAELDSGSGAIARLSLASPPLTASLTLDRLGKPRVHRLSASGPGRNAFVICFDRVTIKGERGLEWSPEQPWFECRLLIIRETVWKSWAGGQSVAPPAEASARLVAAVKPGAALAGPKVDKSAKDGKDDKGAPRARDGAPEDYRPSEEALESELTIAREIHLAASLNGADWTKLEPCGAASVKDQVLAVSKRYENDMRFVREAEAGKGTSEDISAAFKGEGKEASPLEYVCYFNPYATVLEGDGVQVGRYADVQVGRYADVNGDLLDLDLTSYVAVVYVAGVPRTDYGGEVVVEAAISEPSEPFGSVSAA